MVSLGRRSTRFHCFFVLRHTKQGLFFVSLLVSKRMLVGFVIEGYVIILKHPNSLVVFSGFRSEAPKTSPPKHRLCWGKKRNMFSQKIIFVGGLQDVFFRTYAVKKKNIPYIYNYIDVYFVATHVLSFFGVHGTRLKQRNYDRLQSYCPGSAACLSSFSHVTRRSLSWGGAGFHFF